MKMKLLFLSPAIILTCCLVNGQTQEPTLLNDVTHHWWVIDRGGGKSTVDTIVLRSSIGQPIVQRMEYMDTGIVLEGGFIPGLRTQSGGYISHQFNIAEGWNLISIPLLVYDSRKITLFPTSASDAFAYEGTYISEDTIKNGTGYWLKFIDVGETSIIGTSYLLDTVDVKAGWNMVGGLSYPTLASDVSPMPPVTITSDFFSYDAGYISRDTLEPGLGYWIKTSTAGRIVIKVSTSFQNNNMVVSTKTKHTSAGSISSNLTGEYGFSELLITDARGKSTSLYFTVKSADVELDRFELPPPPPSGIFDVRFNSNLMLAIPDKNNITGDQSFPIIINGGEDPFILSWNLDTGDHQYSIQVVYADKQTKKYELSNVGQIKVNTAEIAGLKLLIDGGRVEELPKEFGLQQNYPNPFNPQTTIRYELPVDSKVKIIVYSAVGQIVTMLVDEDQFAGFKSVDWNASGIASGVYFYRLDASSLSDPSKTFTQVKKMILLR